MILNLENFKKIFEDLEPDTERTERVTKKVDDFFSKWDYKVEEFVNAKTFDTVSLLDFLKLTNAQLGIEDVNLFCKEALKKITLYLSLYYQPKYDVPFEFVKLPKIIFQSGNYHFYPIYAKEGEIVTDFWAHIIVHMNVEKKPWQSREEGIHYIQGKFFSGLYGYDGTGKPFWNNILTRKYKEKARDMYNLAAFTMLFKPGKLTMDGGFPERFKFSDPKVIYNVGNEPEEELEKLDLALETNLEYRETKKEEAQDTLFLSGRVITPLSDLLVIGKASRVENRASLVYFIDKNRKIKESFGSFIFPILPTETPDGVIDTFLVKKNKRYVVATDMDSPFKTTFKLIGGFGEAKTFESVGAEKCKIKINPPLDKTPIIGLLKEPVKKERALEEVLPEEKLNKKRGRKPAIEEDEKKEMMGLLKDAGSDGATIDTIVDLLGVSRPSAYNYVKELNLLSTPMKKEDSRYERGRGKVPYIFFSTEEALSDYLKGISNYISIKESRGFKIKRLCDFIF